MSRVLYIDDDADILIIVGGALEVEGHHVVTSTDPRQAVPLAIEHGVDVVVLDVNMPELSGFETLEALRENPETAGLPVLFLSALGDSEHRIRGLRKGAEDYLAKPFEPDELVLRVERLASQRHRGGATIGSAPERVVKALRTGDFSSGELYFGRYRALEVIGEGAMGVVLRGWDPRLKRPVALKTVRLDRLDLSGDSSAALSQLTSEATSLARFNHPNIVAIYDTGAMSEIAYIVMELVDGISLQALLQAGPLTIDQAIHLGVAVARALATAHGHQMVHRDVKPGNIMLGHDNSIKVTDFGVAEAISSLAKGQRIFGTPGFVPPECLHGDHHTPAGDVFALGAVLFKSLTGEPAFAGKTMFEVLAASLKGAARSPHEMRDGIPKPLGTLVTEMLGRDANARPPSLDVERRLTAMIDGEPEWHIDRVAGCPSASSTALESSALIDTHSPLLLEIHRQRQDENSTPRG